MISLPPLPCGAALMPHGESYLWNPALVWLHALSDGLIAVAYFSIPLALIYFVRRRRDVPFPGLFLLFGAFIVACGITHLLEIWTIWQPQHYLTGAFKALTAVVSLVSAVALFRTVPQALKLTGPADLQRVNESLEAHVRVRTADLEAANARLRREANDRERAEAEVTRLNHLLQRRVNELQALFEVLPVGVGIAEDRECKVIRSNNTLARMLGLSRGVNASLSAPAPEAPSNFRVLHHDKPLTPDSLPIQVCAREDRPVLDFEETIERSDGTTLAVLANAVPLHDATGRVTGSVATFQDVTALKAALAASARYAAIVASSEDAIIGKTLDGFVTDWNHAAEKIFGYTAAEMIGQRVTRLLPEERVSEETSALECIRRNERVPQFETVRLGRDGRVIDVSINMSPIRDGAGRVVGVAVSARDITERKQAEQQRREIERKIQETQKLESLGVLAGGIAHDFNNLLTGILGNAALARDELSPTSEIQPFLKQIDKSSRRAADLCKQMLAYSGRGHFIVQSIDLNQLIAETTNLLGISISKTCVLRFNLSPRPAVITADATQIRQIVMNLVINASEAIGERSGVIALATGTVRIDEDYRRTLTHDSGLSPGDYVFLEVSDNGTGMDAATLARIFDPFFTTKFTGRGLGLAAVLGIVRGHQGALKVYSEPGRGTTFKLFLPRSGTVPEAPAPGSGIELPDTRGTGHVLVVDDEETVRTVASRMLAVLGYTTECANDGREAVELYRADPSRFRIVLLDLTMPHLDGEETFRQLRHLNPGVRVVLMSGFNEQEAVSRFTGKGLAGFVQKPFDLESLAAGMRAVALAS
ncbi:PAS domain-containing hybrid sensor histidine kinase/response regulator [Horticoccus sp. 23ND18S-11]|uniref:PAS domain-containing hybrid sensor histidine kinase/response regulator n=1 Tax=Horticoccus sp. 23ND18S-11 TaxID=3391832 RepID=UPI0039C9D40F